MKKLFLALLALGCVAGLAARDGQGGGYGYAYGHQEVPGRGYKYGWRMGEGDFCSRNSKRCKGDYRKSDKFKDSSKIAVGVDPESGKLVLLNEKAEKRYEATRADIKRTFRSPCVFEGRGKEFRKALKNKDFAYGQALIDSVMQDLDKTYNDTEKWQKLLNDAVKAQQPKKSIETETQAEDRQARFERAKAEMERLEAEMEAERRAAQAAAAAGTTEAAPAEPTGGDVDVADEGDVPPPPADEDEGTVLPPPTTDPETITADEFKKETITEQATLFGMMNEARQKEILKGLTDDEKRALLKQRGMSDADISAFLLQ